MNIFDVPITPSDHHHKPIRPNMTQDDAYHYVQKWIAFAVKGFPLIKDATLLPADQSALITAFDIQMSYMSKLADEHDTIDEPDAAEKIRNDIAIMYNNFIILQDFIDIEHADKDKVKYFNQFGSIDDIPIDRIDEYYTMSRKYRRLSYEKRQQ